MLDQNIKTQLKAYLERLESPIENCHLIYMFLQSNRIQYLGTLKSKISYLFNFPILVM